MDNRTAKKHLDTVITKARVHLYEAFKQRHSQMSNRLDLVSRSDKTIVNPKNEHTFTNNFNPHEVFKALPDKGD